MGSVYTRFRPLVPKLFLQRLSHQPDEVAEIALAVAVAQVGVLDLFGGDRVVEAFGLETRIRLRRRSVIVENGYEKPGIVGLVGC